MSLAQGNNTPTRPRIEPGSPDPESDALTIRPVRSPKLGFINIRLWVQDKSIPQSVPVSILSPEIVISTIANLNFILPRHAHVMPVLR